MEEVGVGLTQREAKKRLEEYGPNKLPEAKPPSALVIFLSQFKNPLVYILSISGVVTLAINHLSDAVIIFIAVFINTLLGFVQEFRASSALYSLKKLLHPESRVIRDGELITVDSESIVFGDLVVIGQGNKIPADGKVIFANRFFVEEGLLTGESQPVAKVEGDQVFMGTIVTSGRARFVVAKTGAQTEMGKIAKDVQGKEEDTPLKRNLTKLSKQLALMVFGLVGIVFVVGIFRGLDYIEIFLISVALVVSSIPEGLLVGLTVVLAIGMQKILKRKGLVRNLVSAETLGGVTTICIDKTGTLTQGKMQVSSIYGDQKAIAHQAVFANDLDDPLVIAAYEWGKKITKGKDGSSKRIDSIPFSSTTRLFASLNQEESGQILYINGAPELVLKKSTLSEVEKAKWVQIIKAQTGKGFRLMGMAKKIVREGFSKITSGDIKNLEWVGIISFSDPVREGVTKSLAKTIASGLRVIVITGDYPDTAINVCRQVGLPITKELVILGADIKNISEVDLANKLKGGVVLFARTTPDQKLAIVNALKMNGEVVAMMGDGVNDAPALKHADIGIVVGNASDVAKETADLVLLDSRFETIVAAIEEGRGIFGNIRKIFLYLMCDAFEEIIAVLGAIILALPLPVTAAQILWINLVSDGFPNLALTVDPTGKDILSKKPEKRRVILTNWMKLLIAAVSTLGGIVALLLFYYYFVATGDVLLARSVAFMSLGLNSLIFVFSIRTLTDPFWRQNPFANGWLNWAVIAGIGLQFLPFVYSPLTRFLGLRVLSLDHIMIVFAMAVVMFTMIEGLKGIFRSRLNWFLH